MAVVGTHKIIDRPGVATVVTAAGKHALADGYRVVIAVVDPSGELIYLLRAKRLLRRCKDEW